MVITVSDSLNTGMAYLAGPAAAPGPVHGAAPGDVFTNLIFFYKEMPFGCNSALPVSSGARNVKCVKFGQTSTGHSVVLHGNHRCSLLGLKPRLAMSTSLPEDSDPQCSVPWRVVSLLMHSFWVL